MTHEIGKIIIFAGAILVVVGLVLALFDRIPLLGKLPGDFHFRWGSFHVYFPLATSIALSVLATLVFWIVSRFLRK